jgi:starch phosphorylase
VGGGLYAGIMVSLGDGQEHDSDPAWDSAEAEALYEIREREVIHAFYTRDEQGIPNAWVTRIRESMARLMPCISTNRAACEYTEKLYFPAASAYHARGDDKGKIGVGLANWRHTLEQKWAMIRFGEVKFETDGDQHVFEVQMYLDDHDPLAMRVELYPNDVNGTATEREEMERVQQLVGVTNGDAYRAAVPAAKPA